MDSDTVWIFTIGEVSLQRITDHVVEFGGAVTMRADAAARRTVRTGHAAAGPVTVNETKADFHGH